MYVPSAGNVASASRQQSCQRGPISSNTDWVASTYDLHDPTQSQLQPREGCIASSCILPCGVLVPQQGTTWYTYVKGTRAFRVTSLHLSIFVLDAGNAAGDVSGTATAAIPGADVEALAGDDETGKCLDRPWQLLLLSSLEAACCVPPGGCSSRLSHYRADAQFRQK